MSIRYEQNDGEAVLCQRQTAALPHLERVHVTVRFECRMTLEVPSVTTQDAVECVGLELVCIVCVEFMSTRRLRQVTSPP
jgi:hypothetical protein